MRTFLLALLLLAPYALCAQTVAPLRIGFGWAGHTYTGDLTTEAEVYRRFEPGGHLTVQFDRQKPLRLQLHAGFGRIREQNDGPAFPAEGEVQPNEFVETSFFYTDLRLQWRFFRQFRLQPYVSAGTGFLFYTPKDAEGNFLGENIFTRRPNETYGNMVGTFPLSGGLDFRLSPMLALSAEYTYRLTPTDYLDNIGELGPRSGNDRLHAVVVSMHVSLGLDREPEMEPAPVEAAPAPQMVSTADFEWWAWYQPASQPFVSPLRWVDPQTRPEASVAAPDVATRAQAALAEGRMVQVQYPAGTPLSRIAARHYLSLEQLRRLNEDLAGETLDAERSLWVPDVGMPGE